MKNQKSVLNLLLIGLVVIFLYSCTSDDRPLAKPASGGGTLEILVVTDNVDQWNGTLGDSVRACFGQIIPTLPQAEPMFKMAHLEKRGFSKMFQSHHAILIMTIDRERTEPVVETKENHWAAPQRVIKITAPTESQIMEEFLKYKDTYVELFREVEIERTNKTYANVHETPIIQKLIKDYHMILDVPAGFQMAVSAERFAWIRREPQQFSQALIIYFEDYVDTNQFNPQYIIRKRNLMTREYVPGPADGSYMTTALSVIQPESQTVTLNDNFAIETRGLWEVEGDFMGGPFLSYTTIDEERNRVVTVEGYVYAPNEKKALLLHQLDAIIHTLRFVE